ncbi:hypothetical protein [Weissella minor]|uniref:hypothetical protein n=1 Tax=Weissella minor TaxID=1620 RepID=UPI003AF27B8A
MTINSDDAKALRMQEELKKVMPSSNTKSIGAITLKKRENKKHYNIMLKPSIKNQAENNAAEFGISLSAYIELAIENFNPISEQ